MRAAPAAHWARLGAQACKRGALAGQLRVSGRLRCGGLAALQVQEARQRARRDHA